MKMFVVLSIIFLSLPLFGDENWVSSVQNRVHQEAITWLKQQLAGIKDGQTDISNEFSNEGCQNCILSAPPAPIESPIRILISFAVPDEVWLALSAELSPHQGSFVLRGVPHNSFRELAIKMRQLKEKGLNASVQIDPLVFRKYNIQEVPSFIINNGTETSVVRGNISLKCALELTGAL